MPARTPNPAAGRDIQPPPHDTERKPRREHAARSERAATAGLPLAAEPAAAPTSVKPGFLSRIAKLFGSH